MVRRSYLFGSVTALAIALTFALIASACGADHDRVATDLHARATTATTATTAAAGTPVTTGVLRLRDPRHPIDVYAYTRRGMMSPAVAGVPERVYVPNSDSNTVDVIDPSTYQVVEHFAVGA